MNRVIYSANTVLASDSPGSDNHTGLFEVKNLDRIQSASISINSAVNRYKQIGYGTFLFNNFYTAPEISCEINYYCSDTSNESILGIPVDDSSILSSFSTTGKDINLFLLSDIEDGRDITSLNNFSGLNVFGIGNAFITNYSVRGAINEIPAVNISFIANNILYDTYTGKNLVPSLTLSGNQTGYRYNISSGVFNKANYISNQSGRLNAIRPGDIQVVLAQPSLAGGVYNTTTGKIQNFQINIPFDRKNLLGFGNNFSFDKKLMYPVVGTVSFNALFDKLVTGNYSNVFTFDEVSNMQIKLNNCNAVNQIVYTIENAKLVSENFNFDIGSSVNFEGSFQFPIDLYNGFKILGNSEVYDVSATTFLNNLNITDTTIRTAINNFVVNLKNNNLWDKMSGIYPFVGGTSGLHKFNLKNPIDSNSAFRLDFQGAGTVHTTSGVEFLGTNDYANTFFNPSIHLSGNPVHFSVLSLQDSNVNLDSPDMGCQAFGNAPRLMLYLEATNTVAFDAYDYTNNRISISNPNSQSFYVASKVTNTSGNLLLFRSSETPIQSAKNSTMTSGSLPNYNVYIGAINNYGTPATTSDRKFGFVSFGDGLTSGESVKLYTAVKNLQFDLNRNLQIFT